MSAPRTRPVSRAEVRDIDRRAMEEFAMPGIILMENAGRGAAERILAEYGGARPGRHVIACGGGNNGGDGFVIARHLFNAGVDVQVMLAADPGRLSPDAAVNHEIVRRMGIPIVVVRSAADVAAHKPDLDRADHIVDALLGTGFTGSVRTPLVELIEAINRAASARVVAVDLPSGLDCDTGCPSNATIRAELTVTFVAPKLGFSAPAAAAYVGRVVVVDIGAPRSLQPGV